MQAFFPQHAHDGVFQRRHVHIIGGIAQNPAELLQTFAAGGLGGFGGCFPRSYANFTLAGLAVDGGSGVGAFKQRGHLAGDGALAAQHPKRVAVDGAVLAGQQQRAHLLQPHGLHLPGYAGHQSRAVALGILEPGTGGGAVVVDDFMAVSGHHGLLAVILGGAALCPGKESQNLVPLCLIKMQGVAKGFGHCLLGQVVLGRAKTAGEDEQVAAAFSLGHQLPQAGGVIADDMLVQHTDAQLGQFAAQKLRIGV